MGCGNHRELLPAAHIEKRRPGARRRGHAAHPRTLGAERPLGERIEGWGWAMWGKRQGEPSLRKRVCKEMGVASSLQD